MTAKREWCNVGVNKRVIVSLGLLIGLLAVQWCGPHLIDPRKRKASDAPSEFSIVSLDDRSKAFLEERDTKWYSKDGVDYALSDIMSAAGLAPSMRGLTNLLTCSTPAYLRWKIYRYLRPRQASAAETLADIKDSWCEIAALDNANAKATLFVSEDGHLGLLWTGTNVVTVFQDATNGLQYARYHQK